MLKITPINFDEANEFVRIHHRHHKPVTGMKFCVAVSDCNRIPCKHDYLRFITVYDKNRDYPYRSKEVGYRFATPLTLEEAKEYVKG